MTKELENNSNKSSYKNQCLLKTTILSAQKSYYISILNDLQTILNYDSYITMVSKAIEHEMLTMLTMPKNANISKIKGILVLNGMISETTFACVLTYQISGF